MTCPLRPLTATEWAEVRSHGLAYTEQFIAARVKQIADANKIKEKVGQLRDKAAAARIQSKIANGDLNDVSDLTDKLETALAWQNDHEGSIRRKTERYIRELQITGEVSQATIDALRLTHDQKRRLEQHDHSKTPVDRKLRRMLRQNCKQGVATLNMHLGLVGKGGSIYATPFEMELRNEQKKRWQKFGKSVVLQRGDEEVSMLDVMQSAGKKKLSEVCTLTKGLEKYAAAAGLSWAFLTLTTPPRMHPNPTHGKKQWDGTTPDMAHDWLFDAWHRAESRLRKQCIIISGLRVVEPHKDACPHWHVLIFAPIEQMATIEAIIRQQVEWRSEQGMKFVLDDGRAKASSYCFKYVLKTINSIEQLEGEHGSVDAWRSTWGIRSFQFFGMPPIGLWRRLRAVKECPDEPLLAGLWRAASRGDGHAFIGLAGGLNVKSKDRPVISRTAAIDDKTKSIEFILQDTAESIKFNFQKWQQTKKTPETRAGTGVEVILNYPRKAEAAWPMWVKTTPDEPSTPSLTRRRAACPPTRGAQGDNPLDPDEGRGCLIRGFPCPSSLPTLSPVGWA